MALLNKDATADKPQPSIYLMGRDIFTHVLEAILDIKSSELESALKFLHFRYSIKLLYYLEHFIRRNIEVELSSRATIFICKRF